VPAEPPLDDPVVPAPLPVEPGPAPVPDSPEPELVPSSSPLLDGSSLPQANIHPEPKTIAAAHVHARMT
jgi:hypothetical protein